MKQRVVPSKRNVNTDKTSRAVVALSVLELAVLLLVLYRAFRSGGTLFEGGGDIAVTVLTLLVGVDVVMALRISKHTRKLETNIETIATSFEMTEKLNGTLRAQRHDFLNHLQVVYGLMEMGEYASASDYIKRVYKDIRDVSRVLRTASPAINALLQAKSITCQDKGIALDLVIESPMDALPMEDWQMCRVLSNLIDNAVDATLELPAGAARMMRVVLREDETHIRFCVENNGAAVPAQVAAHMFHAGFSTRGEGRGMGLAIVHEEVTRAGGTVRYERRGDWTCFSGALPKAGAAPGDADNAMGDENVHHSGDSNDNGSVS
nr:Spo0B domain-containing protein [Maliibacterium massiliense]